MKPKQYDLEIVFIKENKMRDEAAKYLFNRGIIELESEEQQVVDRYLYDKAHRSWKSILINGKETLYLISNLGEIFSLRFNKIMSPSTLPNGYLQIILHTDDGNYHKLIHRLVAEAFIEHSSERNVVNHKNGKKDCNWVGNLEWVTNQENIDHAVATGLINNKGENQANHKYTTEQIEMICKLLESGDSNTVVAEKLSIPRHVVEHVKSGSAWSHISSKYSIPKTLLTTRKEKYTEKVKSLILQNKTNREIIDELGLPNDKSTKQYLYDLRRPGRIKVKSSTTIEQLSDT